MADPRRAAARLTSYVTYLMAQTCKLNKMHGNVDNKHKLMFTLLVVSVPMEWRVKHHLNDSHVLQIHRCAKSRSLAVLQKFKTKNPSPRLQVFMTLYLITAIDITARDRKQTLKKRKKENRKRIHGENCHTSEMQQSNSILTPHTRSVLKFRVCSAHAL